MSGLVAVVSHDLATLVRGPEMLATLRHMPEWGTLAVAADGVWLGVCGRQGEHWVADAREANPQAGLAPAPFVAAFCGDLLNKKAMVAALGLPSTSDPAEIVLSAYQRWGEALFAHLEGAFALALCDARAGLVLAGTDACMVATLHVVRFGGDLLFASEAKAFLADPRFVADLDQEALADLVATGRVLGARTLFSGVGKLPHGCHWKIAGGALSCVQHFDVRALVPGVLRGREYVERTAATARSLTAEAFSGGEGVLPLTGGLDSRMFAAAMSRDAEVFAMTFGSELDSDCVLAARIAHLRGMTHWVIPFDPSYVSRFAAETVWLLEGRLNPVLNLTGSLMNKLPPARYFVSGAGAAAGRRFERSRMLVPDWAWDHASEADFERLYTSYAELDGLPLARLDELVVDGDALRDVGLRRIQEMLVSTRGLNAVDRLDVHTVTERERFGQAGLGLADVWVAARAPLLTQRWLASMLSGESNERIDDRARIRLVRRLDPRVAAVPWTVSRLPLPLSELLVSGLRPVGAVTSRRLPRIEGVGASPRRTSEKLKSLTHATVAVVKHRLYAHGEKRDLWLRGPSRTYVEEILLSNRSAERGLLRAGGARRLWDEHLRGVDHSDCIGLLLGIELWMRLFVDRDQPPSLARESQK